MITRGFRSSAVAATVLSMLAACGGGNNGTTNVPPIVASTAPGIWQGTDAFTSLKITGLVSETGFTRFIRADGAQYLGTVLVNGTAFSASLEALLPFGSTFPDGSTYGTVTMTGTMVAQKSVTGTESLTTSAGTTSSGALSLTFDANYDVISLPASIQGTYVGATSTAVMTITEFGLLSYQDPTTGCLITGYVTVIDPSYNLYDLSVTPTGCPAAAVAMDGTSLSGFATINNTVTPNLLLIGVSGGVTPEIGLAYTLHRK